MQAGGIKRRSDGLELGEQGDLTHSQRERPDPDICRKHAKLGTECKVTEESHVYQWEKRLP